MSNFQQSHIDTAWKNHRIKLSEKRGNHSAVKIDDHSFVVSGGFDGKKLSSVDLIDIVKNSSNQPIQLPELAEGRCDHSSHFHNGYLMITGGGLNSTNRLKINTNLDKKSNWETKYIPDFQDKMRQYCTSIIDDDKLYVIGGQLYNDSKALSSIIAIDLPDDGGGKLNSSNGIVSFSSWKHIVDMKQARIEHASVKIGKKIFTMGGRIITDHSTKDIRVFDSMEIWDLSSNKISEGKKLPTTLYAAAAVAVGKFIVVTGGRSAPDVQNNNVFFYDTEKDIWNTDTSNPFKTPRYGHSAVVLHHNTIVVCGGFDASNKSVDSLECSNFSNLIRYNGSGEKVVKIAFTDEKVCKTNVYQWEEIASSKPFFPSENMITTKSKATVGFHVGGKKWSNDVSTLRIRLLNIDADADVATLLKEIVPKEGYSEVKKIFEFEHSSLRGSAKGYKVVLDGNGGDITASFVVKDFEFQLKIQDNSPDLDLIGEAEIYKLHKKFHNDCLETLNIKDIKAMIKETDKCVMAVEPVLLQTTAHVLVQRDDVTVDMVKLLLNHNADAAKVRDCSEETPLSYALKLHLSFEIVSAIIDACPASVKAIDADGNSALQYMIKNYGNNYVYANKVIMDMVTKCPDSLQVNDNEGHSPVHNAIMSSANNKFDLIEMVSKMASSYSHIVQVKDKNGRTPLHLAIEYESQFIAMEAILEKFTDAVAQEDSKGLSPFSNLVSKVFESAKKYDDESFSSLSVIKDHVRKLRCLMPYAKNSRYRINQLCAKDSPTCLLCLFWVMTNRSPDDSDIEERFYKESPILDLNDEVIPGYYFVELLADLGTEEATDILFQIKAPLLDSPNNKFPITITVCNAKLQLKKAVEDKVWKQAAERASMSTIKRLKEWGETYGRLLGIYRIVKDDGPKHQSKTCVVFFATQLEQDNGSRNKKERKVALKAMSDESAFLREIENRPSERSEYLVDVIAAYSTKSKEELLQGSKTEDKFAIIKHIKDLSSSLQHSLVSSSPYDDKENSLSESNPMQLEFLLVMECGIGEDLSDIISHQQNIAGKNLRLVIYIALEIAKCLQFLNEDMGISHGDVKERNVISRGVAKGYLMIDLDNSARLGDPAGQKETSTGYLPPEQAKVLYHKRTAIVGDANDSRCMELKEELNELLICWKASNRKSMYEDYIKDKKKEIRKHENRDQPAPVIATPQYDMWCFGVLLFKLCTGSDLFQWNLCEDVTDNGVLKEIKDWSVEDFRKKTMNCKALNLQVWCEMKRILGKLLMPKIDDRYGTWCDLINDLKNYHQSAQLEKIVNLLHENPHLMIQMDRLKCPYLYRFITEEEYNNFVKTLETRDSPKKIENAVEMINGSIDRAQKILDNFSDKKKVMTQLFDFSLGFVGKSEHIYLQLLCGLSFEPVVSYKIKVKTYSKKVEKVAKVSSDVVALALNFSTAWNCAAGVAFFLGVPIPGLPKPTLKKIQKMLQSVNKTSKAEEFKNRNGLLTAFDLNEFDEFLKDLEENKSICHLFDNANLDKKEAHSWRKAFRKKIQTIEGDRRVVCYISTKTPEVLQELKLKF